MAAVQLAELIRHDGAYRTGVVDKHEPGVFILIRNDDAASPKDRYRRYNYGTEPTNVALLEVVTIDD